MAIANYSTDVEVTKSAGEITGILATRGVRSIATQFDEDGSPSGIAFSMNTEYGMRYFEVPIRVDGVLRAMERDKSIPRSKVNRDQAARVAWRIAKDWLRAQSALIEAGLVTTDEALFAWMVDGKGRSVYEVTTTAMRKEIEK